MIYWRNSNLDFTSPEKLIASLEQKPKQKNLISELGDVQCMIKLTCNHFNLDVDKISEASDNKYNKLRKWSNLIDG